MIHKPHNEWAIDSSLQQSLWQRCLTAEKRCAGGPGTRRLVLRSYLIFYEVDKATRTVDILRFWHAARDPDSLKWRRGEE